MIINDDLYTLFTEAYHSDVTAMSHLLDFYRALEAFPFEDEICRQKLREALPIFIGRLERALTRGNKS